MFQIMKNKVWSRDMRIMEQESQLLSNWKLSLKAHKSIKWWIKNQFVDSAKYFEEMSAQVAIKIWRLLKSR